MPSAELKGWERVSAAAIEECAAHRVTVARQDSSALMHRNDIFCSNV